MALQAGHHELLKEPRHLHLEARVVRETHRRHANEALQEVPEEQRPCAGVQVRQPAV